MTSITDYLNHTAEKFPEKIAFVDEKREISFSDLRMEARKVASVLIRMGVRRQPIAVFLDKSASCVAAFLGVAYSGNFYTPLDTMMPETRIRKILDTLQPMAVITDKEHKEQAVSFAEGAEVFTYEDAMDEQADEASIDETASHVIDTDVCYVLFTSGSTGNPKGVIVPHRAVIDYVSWFKDTFSINEKDILGNQAPLYFDLSIQDVYMPILTGCTTRLIPHETFAFPTALMRMLANEQVNVIVWSPSALCVVANLKGLRSKMLPKLRLVAFCGEVMPVKQLNKWREKYPETKFVNMYGPTEACDACSYYIIDRDFDASESLPIGRPCKNTDIFVIANDHEQIFPDDLSSVGELCIRGTSLAYGYYNNPEKTNAAFVQNPLNKAYPEIIYRTGDLVKWNEHGELVYVGRKDFQIKHMGYRIELGEIETAASSVEHVDANACIYDPKRDRIHMFYAGKATEDELTAALAGLIPEYMLPSDIHHLKSMPLNLNGKIDRNLLKTKIAGN